MPSPWQTGGNPRRIADHARPARRNAATRMQRSPGAEKSVKVSVSAGLAFLAQMAVEPLAPSSLGSVFWSDMMGCWINQNME